MRRGKGIMEQLQSIIDTANKYSGYIRMRRPEQSIKAAEKHRKNFTFLMLRELGTPLKYVRTALQENQNQCGEDVFHALTYMDNLLGNIAEYERMEQGKVQVGKRRFALDEMLETCLGRWRKYADKVGVSFTCTVCLGNHAYYGDDRLIKQMLNHAIGNCFRASKKGGRVRLSVETRNQENMQDKFTIKLEDGGIPASGGHFGRVYTLMAPGDEKQIYTGEKEESMISLAIAGKLAVMMGGTCSISRTSKKASRVSIEIPLRRMPEMPDVLGGSGSGQSSILSRYTLLYAPARNNQKKGAAFLRNNGAHVETAKSGAEGIEVILGSGGHELDAVIVEEMLGDMDYVQFVKRLRAEQLPRAKRIPVIALVENAGYEDIREGLKYGLNSWLNDSGDIERLRLILDMMSSDGQ